MTDVVICEPIRTAVGRYGGAIKDITAAELGAIAVRSLIERTGIDGASIDDVILVSATRTAKHRGSEGS